MLQLRSAIVLGCFVAQTRGLIFDRAGDNAVFVREPCNLFDPSCVKVGLRGQVYILFGVFRGQSRIYYKSVGTLPENAVKCSVFLRIMQLLRHICDITMNLR